MVIVLEYGSTHSLSQTWGSSRPEQYHCQAFAVQLPGALHLLLYCTCTGARVWTLEKVAGKSLCEEKLGTSEILGQPDPVYGLLMVW